MAMKKVKDQMESHLELKVFAIVTSLGRTKQQGAGVLLQSVSDA